MADLPLNEPAGVLVKTTCVDFPGMIAGSFFLKGCNLRCPYCYNTGLVLNNDAPDSLNSIQDLFNHLEKRQGILKGLVISGGEPLINPYTPVIIRYAKNLGYKIKIDTNGTFPEKIENLLSNNELSPDFIAMDIKTSPKRYKTDICNKNQESDSVEQKILKSINLLSALPTEQREFRTVLVPQLVTKEDINKIATILPTNASWQFAQFRNENCLNPEFNTLTPYTDSELNELVALAKTKIPGAVLR